MSLLDTMVNAIPVAPLKICALPGCEEKAVQIEVHLRELQEKLLKRRASSTINYHYNTGSFLLGCSCPRFGSGEAKGILKESVRGMDLFLLVDVCNHSLSYEMFGQLNRMSPDDHYQDLKRVIAACGGKAGRITVIMPFLYEGRQHRRISRESLDCAVMLRELESMGVHCLIKPSAEGGNVMPDETTKAGYPAVVIALANDKPVNLRIGPSTDDRIITKLPVGTKVAVVTDTGDWCFVDTGECLGYMMSKFLAEVDHDGDNPEVDPDPDPDPGQQGWFTNPCLVSESGSVIHLDGSWRMAMD